MKNKEITPCTEVKTKIRETFKNGKKVFVEETYVLTRKIKRQRAKQMLKAMEVKHPCRKEYNPLTKEYLSSSLSVHWREYGSKI